MVFIYQRPAQAIQKAVSPKPAMVGAQPTKVVAPKGGTKTKKVAKATPVKGKKIVGPRKGKSVPKKGKPLAKKTAKKVVRAR